MMILDSIQILDDLVNEFGEGEVALMKYDFLPGIELRLITHGRSVSHQFLTTELDTATPEIFNRIYKQLFAMLVKDVKLNGY